ncbi:MAG: 4'-phosphopantetheinyl transferase superfamily protein [Vicinamibacterales bacterium]
MPRLGPRDVRAWFASTDVFADPARVARACGWLDEAERHRFDRFRHDVDRHMFLLGRAMSRAIVGRLDDVSPTAWRWREGPHGRPEIAAATDLRFNLAHSAGLVVCAAARGRDVGVDVEDLARRPVEPEIVPRYCAPREAADIRACGAAGWHARFLAYWTLKEAYLKALGLGISVPLAEIEFSLGPPPTVAFLGSLTGGDDRWWFHLGPVSPRHLVAVAAGAADGAPALEIAPFPETWLP